MQGLEDEHGAAPEGLCVVTSRGYALIYQWPNDTEVHPATKHPCAGIDIRGRCSYIVIPPSIHPGTDTAILMILCLSLSVRRGY